VRCKSVYPPSATGPYSDDHGWSGPLRCVLSDGHEGDRHWNTGINWTAFTCGAFGCYRLAVVQGTRPNEWVPGWYCDEHGASLVPVSSTSTQGQNGEDR
jgi:hypothetical protein